MNFNPGRFFSILSGVIVHLADRLVNVLVSRPSVRALLFIYVASVPVRWLTRTLRSPWVIGFTLVLFVIEIILLPIDVLDGKLDNEPNRAVAAYIDQDLAGPIREVKPWEAYDAFRDHIDNRKPVPTVTLPDPVLGLSPPIGGIPALPTPAVCPTAGLGGCETASQRANRQATATACGLSFSLGCPVGSLFTGPTPSSFAPPVVTPVPLSARTPGPEDTARSFVDPFLRIPGGLYAAASYMAGHHFAGWLLMVLPVIVTAIFLRGAASSPDFNFGYFLLPSGIGLLLLLTVGLSLLLQVVLLGAFWVVNLALGLLGLIKLAEFAVSAPVKAAEFVEELYPAAVGAGAVD